MRGIAATDDVLGLLAACRANYLDDTPRLQLADALQEAGDPLGEYVRLAVRQAAGKSGWPTNWFGLSAADHWDAAANALVGPALQLFRRHGGVWAGPGWNDPKLYRFERGLPVIRCRVDASTRIRHHLDWWATHLPLVAGVAVRCRTYEELSLMAEAFLAPCAGLVELEVSNLSPEAVADGLSGVRDVGVTNVVRVVPHQPRPNHSTQFTDNWVSRFARTWADSASEVRRRCVLYVVDPSATLYVARPNRDNVIR